MLKDSEISRHLTRRTHRSYTPEFKAKLVAACQQPGVSIAALAGEHQMNAKVLHRWLKEHKRNGCHQLAAANLSCTPLATATATSPVPAFIPVKLPCVIQEPATCDIKVELRKGAVSMRLTWPTSAAGDLAQWSRAILK